MANENRSITSTYSTETPVEVALSLIELFKGARESAANLLSKHLDNESARLRIRELDAQAALAREERRGAKSVS